MRGRAGVALVLAAAAALGGCAGAPPAPPPAPAPWDWSGERVIRGTVEVPPGVTLRLAPGTVLRFAFVDADGDGVGDAGLHVLGRIEAVGTPEAPVVLTSAEADPRPGDWRGIVFDNAAGNRLEECRLEYAEHALHAHFSAATVTRCRIERNVEGTRLGNSRFEITHCLVRGNESKGVNFFACANRIRRNLVTGNADGVFLFEADTASVVEENDILGNERSDVRLGDFHRGDLRLGRNWFGTTDEAAIRGRIHDGEDEPGLGRVIFEAAPGPFATGWEGE